MRILLVTGPFPKLTFIFRMAVGLARRGHTVTVAARNRGDWEPFRHTPLPETLSVHYLPPDSNLSRPRRAVEAFARALITIIRRPRPALALLKDCRQQPQTPVPVWRRFLRYLPFLALPKPDVIQFEFLVTWTQYPHLSEILHSPDVISCRGADLHMLEQRSPQQQRLRLEALRAASAIHCVSQELAGEVTRLTGRRDGLWVNRPAVPVEQITPKASYEDHARPRIVAVGRLTWKKGFDYLLAALSRLEQEGASFEAEIIGAGDLFAPLRFSIDDLGLGSCVRLAGRISPEDVLDHLREADLFVLSSHEEGIANAALEAMAVGLPVVTTTAGGMTEAVRDGIDGLVVPVRDIPALTDALRILLTDAPLREEMGRSARAQCLVDFSLEQQIDVFEQLYAAATGVK